MGCFPLNPNRSMPTLDSYRKSAFLQNEPGRHLDEWRTAAYWKSVQSQSGSKAPAGWSHYVLEPPERALDYLDWLNHRHSNKPYFLRRLLLPTWLLAPILEAVTRQQLQRLQGADCSLDASVADYALKSEAWELQIQSCLEGSNWIVPLMRAIRLNSEWLRAREKLIQASVEAPRLQAGAVPEPIEVRARPWDRPGLGSWAAKPYFQQLLAQQKKADEALSIVLPKLAEKEAAPSCISKLLLLADKNPRKGRNHYAFENPSQCIDYLIWLNHRHPDWPYPLRRAKLPLRTLTRFIEAVALHQIVQIDGLALRQEPVRDYLEQADAWGPQIEACLQQSGWSVPMMRVVRLNAAWLQSRQQLLDRHASPASLDPARAVVEVHALPWKTPSRKSKPTAQTLRELLALQANTDRELRLSAAAPPR